MRQLTVDTFVETFGLEEGLRLFNAWYWSMAESSPILQDAQATRGRRRARLSKRKTNLEENSPVTRE